MKLSEMIRDEIDGAEECRGRDSQLTEWAAAAERMEDGVAVNKPQAVQHYTDQDKLARAQTQVEALKSVVLLLIGSLHPRALTLVDMERIQKAMRGES